MPTVTEQPVKGFAHCIVPVCPGYRQEEVDALRVETAFAFKDNGGDMPGIERSNVRFQFADEDERACPSCGRAREITGTRRPSYQPLSGHDPMGLLKVGPFDPNRQQEIRDERVEELESKLAEQDAKIDRLLAALENRDTEPEPSEEG